jgi:hypothetical protein
LVERAGSELAFGFQFAACGQRLDPVASASFCTLDLLSKSLFKVVNQYEIGHTIRFIYQSGVESS